MEKEGIRLVEVHKFRSGTVDGEQFVQIPLSTLADLEQELTRVESTLAVVYSVSIAGLDVLPETLIDSIALARSALASARFDYVTTACAFGKRSITEKKTS